MPQPFDGLTLSSDLPSNMKDFEVFVVVGNSREKFWQLDGDTCMAERRHRAATTPGTSWAALEALKGESKKRSRKLNISTASILKGQGSSPGKSTERCTVFPYW